MIRHILFDLDGTLLPMDQDRFGEWYLPRLARHAAPEDIPAEDVLRLIYQGWAAMVRNDGSATNEAVFNRCLRDAYPEQAEAINAARARGGRIVCVGTTSVRTLETVATEDGVVHPGSGFTQIFITPGVKIKAVDALITNFHLPQSTLLMLISALMGRENALDVYRQAVEERYRFFSFGDAMMITGKPQKDI